VCHGPARRNEKRFYRHPLNRIVAVVDDAPNLGLALADLGIAGYEVSKVNVLSGLLGPAVRLRSRRPPSLPDQDVRLYGAEQVLSNEARLQDERSPWPGRSLP
jgi:hypothetical protein